MTNANQPISRSAFLRNVAGAAVGMLVAWALPAGAMSPSRRPFKHPEPRPGITGEHVLPEAKLPADEKVRAAFAAARENAAIFDGLYCACRCQKSQGHRSLLACYETEQPTGCLGCQDEATFVARQIAAGRSLAEIRKAIDEEYG
jgi:hypothetical protein